MFARWTYDLASARKRERAVPRFYIRALPDDLASLEPLAARKALFLLAVRPQMLCVNERILRHRAALLELSERQHTGGTFNIAATKWLAKMGELYGVDAPIKNIKEMLRRVDIVPPSLALAQTAAETGWGTSRFAVEGQALFGQWTFSERVHGMIPGERTGTSTHRVRSFSRLIESVWGYTVNLNSHKAYAGSRECRAAIRAAGQTPRGDDLAAELVAYSQQGPAYVALLRRLITENDLGALDTARLDRMSFIGS